MGCVAAGVGSACRLFLQRMLRPQSVTDVDGAFHEAGVLVDEILIHPAGRDDVIGDIVEDREVGAGLEHDRDVGEIGTAIGECGQHRDLDVRMAEPAVGQARPQDRMHLRHVRAPEHERVGRLEIVVAAHRLVHAEGTHECVGCGRHAVARVGIEIVGAKTRTHQLGGGVAFPHRPLARAEHAEGGRTFLLQCLLRPGGHDVEGLVPTDGRELAVLVEDTVLLSQQRRGETVAAVHDLRQEVSLDAIEAAVHFRQRVAVGGNHFAFLHADHHAASGTAETAWRLRPFDFQSADTAGDRLGHRGHADVGRSGRNGGCMGLQYVTP